MVLCKWTREFRDLLLGRTVAGVMVALSVVARMMAAKLRLMTPRPRGRERGATGAKQKQSKATPASQAAQPKKQAKQATEPPPSKQGGKLRMTRQFSSSSSSIPPFYSLEAKRHHFTRSLPSLVRPTGRPSMEGLAPLAPACLRALYKAYV